MKKIKKTIASVLVKCTPKVRQTLGGAFNYAKEETQHKILAGIQDICYNGYAREPFRI